MHTWIAAQLSVASTNKTSHDVVYFQFSSLFLPPSIPSNILCSLRRICIRILTKSNTPQCWHTVSQPHNRKHIHILTPIKRRNIVAVAQNWSCNHTSPIRFCIRLSISLSIHLVAVCIGRDVYHSQREFYVFKQCLCVCVCACVAIGCCLNSIVYANCNDDINDNKTDGGDRELPQNLH